MYVILLFNVYHYLIDVIVSAGAVARHEINEQQQTAQITPRGIIGVIHILLILAVYLL